MTKIEKTGINFKPDVFAAVAVVDAKASLLCRINDVILVPDFLQIVRSCVPYAII